MLEKWDQTLAFDLIVRLKCFISIVPLFHTTVRFKMLTTDLIIGKFKKVDLWRTLRGQGVGYNFWHICAYLQALGNSGSYREKLGVTTYVIALMSQTRRSAPSLVYKVGLSLRKIIQIRVCENKAVQAARTEYILLKIIEGPMLSIIILMHFEQNVFWKPILRTSLNFSDIFDAQLPSETAKRKW